MAEIRVSTGSRLPDADEPTAPAISFGEGATDTMLNILRAMGGWNVQITDGHGTFEAEVHDDPVVTDDRDIWSVQVWRKDDANVVRSEVVPLDRLLRLHVW